MNHIEAKHTPDAGTAAPAIRSTYIAKLVGRCAILLLCLLLYALRPDQFTVLDGMNFFQSFSPLHVLWGIWIVDMVCQVIPVRRKLPLGSQKLFLMRFRPVLNKINRERLRRYIVDTSKAAYKVLILWAALIAAIGALYFTGVLSRTALFFISAVFYVCDLICVLVWCPFRLMMKTRCCTTCRIFNWDHLMMFSPLIFAGGFFSVSLVALSLIVWLVWEFCILLYPERFWEHSNDALKCVNCTDKLCTQYCRKLRQ